MFGLAGIRQWIYTLSVKGRFQRLHRASGAVLLAILFVTPWLTVDDRPVLQIDLPARRLYLLGSVFTPTDTAFLAVLGLGAAFALFFFTSLFGRLWCGFACPQTVFLEEWIRPVEKFFEGDRGQRMALDKRPWSFDKIWRKAGKWGSYVVISGVVAFSLVSYFAGAQDLLRGNAGPVAYAFVGVLTVGLYLDFAWFREQFCNYLCPYARFQGALTDDSSLVISYDAVRGEPRKDAGACIDCKKCVAVCPQGIDIRNGFQLECVSCARCIDACEGVMLKLEQPSLVSYTALSGHWRFLRGRTAVYGTLLVLLTVAGIALAWNRHDLNGMVSRAPGSLFNVDADGWTRNTFLVRLTSEEMKSESYTISVTGLPERSEVMVPPVTLGPGEQVTVPLVVRIAPDAGTVRTLPLEVVVQSHDDTLILDATFKTDADAS